MANGRESRGEGSVEASGAARDAGLAELERLAAAAGPPARRWARWLSVIVRAAASGDLEPLRRDEEIQARVGLAGPVVVVVGGCRADLAAEMEAYRDLLLGGFAGFRGTVVSGGTAVGIPGLVGELAATRPGDVHAIGYLPRRGRTAGLRDRRYGELRDTDADDFSALEPLASWADILASGVRPADVRVLGINGGPIAAFEYRLGAVLGARVGVVAASGRAADDAVRADEARGQRVILPLPRDLATVRYFLRAQLPHHVLRETIGRRIHERYQEKHANDPPSPSLLPWPELPEELKESNRQQADDIGYKLSLVGCEIVPATPGVAEADLPQLAPDEILYLAEMEHGRWNVERLLSGWRLTDADEKDVANRLSPHLLPWSALQEHVKGWDRDSATDIRKLLAEVGLAIARRPGG